MIKPTLSFVLIRMQPKHEFDSIIRPDQSTIDFDHFDCVVEELGPDVAKVPEIKVGSKVLLRGDTKAYGVGSDKTRACVDSRWIMAVIEEEPLPAELVALINQ